MFCMTKIRRAVPVAVICLAAGGTLAAADQPAWKPMVFTGDEVTGDHVLAIWQFQPGAELNDGRGHAGLTLSGRARVVADEHFGGILECFDNPPGVDKANGAATAWRQGPTPAGAFTVEAWVKLKANPEKPDWKTACLVDKTYVPHTHENKAHNKDYFFSIRQLAQGKTVSLQAGVGLGEEVITFASGPVEMAPETWRHLAFAYNGNGTGMLFVDGRLVGKKSYPGKGAAAPGPRSLAIGERSGSTHSGLPGYLAQVRIVRGLSALVARLAVEIRPPFQRTAFERMEQGQSLLVQLSNLDARPTTQVVLHVNDGLTRREISVGELAGESAREIRVPLSCAGKAGEYAFQAAATGQVQNERVSGHAVLSYHLCNRRPEFMPVVMWGGASVEQIKQTGFTHSLHWMDHLDMQAWQAGEPIGFHSRFDETRESLNQALVQGVRVLGKMSPGGYFKGQKSYAQARQPYLCHDRQGHPTAMVNFSLSRVQQFAFDAGRSVANNVGMFPAVDMMIADSEFRDGSQLSFRDEDRAAFRAWSGHDIPDQIQSKTGVKYDQLAGFPDDRILPDDDKILAFYKWFWGGGDGYAGFLTQDRKGLTAPGSRLRVMWDPVVRCPSKWGSGGEVDWIGHWTYVYPDPLVMGLATDEVFAMGKGGPKHQQPVKMTQIIWYRSATTGPLPADKSKWAEWEQRLPEARFITIPPDMLEIALWQKLARPVRAIMYHGAGSLWDKGRPGGYDFTHPGTAPRLASLVSKVVQPFGPMLLHVPDRKARVAMLESFASQIFYGGSTYGTMRTPVGRMHGVLTRAHLQPEIVYDETILRDGLDPFQVLVMPVCPVLTESVARRIVDWQAQGGILVADELLAPRLTPDILIRQVQSDDKTESLDKAKQLRSELGDACLPYAEADTPEAILRVRTFGTTDYLFAFNDRRTYGDYVGQHRKVMEQGLPTKAVLTVRRPAGNVYDLLAGKAVNAAVNEGSVQVAAEFGPGEGRLYMITERPIAKVTVSGPSEAARSAGVPVTVTVTDDAGRPLDAVVPLRVEVTDAQGNAAEHSGWHAAPAGQLTLTLDLAPNDAPGTWTLAIRELASGKTAQKSLLVK